MLKTFYDLTGFVAHFVLAIICVTLAIVSGIVYFHLLSPQYLYTITIILSIYIALYYLIGLFVVHFHKDIGIY